MSADLRDTQRKDMEWRIDQMTLLRRSGTGEGRIEELQQETVMGLCSG